MRRLCRESSRSYPGRSHVLSAEGLPGRQRLGMELEKSAEGIVVALACNGPDMMKA